MGYDVVGAAALDEVDDILLAEILLERQHRLEGYHQLLLCLYPLLGVQTVVAVAAVVLVIFLTEVVKQYASAAYRRLGIGCRLLEQLPAYVLLVEGFALHEFLELVQVFVGVEGYADALASIPACASGLLVVSLQALGYVVVEDESHVGLVDAHAEGYGGHDDIDALHEEVVLGLRARGAVEAGMIGRRLDVVGLELGRQFFYRLARETVDDTALARVLLDKEHNLLVDLLGLGSHLVVEVGPVEGTLVLDGVLYLQIFLDIASHLVGGSSREGYHRRVANLVDGRSEVAVLGSEVVSPLRDAVGFIDGIERNLERLEKLEVLGLVERLGSHVEQLGLAVAHVIHHLCGLRLGERRVEVMGQSVVLADAIDGVDLVFHQGDEWRHDDGSALHEERRQLVTQALASAGGHEHKDVVPRHERADNGFLVAFERVKAEIVL